VTNINFASATPHAKSIETAAKKLRTDMTEHD